MTDEEAANRQAKDKNTIMLAVPLRDPVTLGQIGVLYLDATTEEEEEGDLPDTFGTTVEDQNALIAELEALFNDRLGASLAELVEDAKRKSPQLSLEGA